MMDQFDESEKSSPNSMDLLQHFLAQNMSKESNPPNATDTLLDFINSTRSLSHVAAPENEQKKPKKVIKALAKFLTPEDSTEKMPTKPEVEKAEEKVNPVLPESISGSSPNPDANPASETTPFSENEPIATAANEESPDKNVEEEVELSFKGSPEENVGPNAALSVSLTKVFIHSNA